MDSGTRLQATFTINSDIPTLKTFLLGYFSSCKLGAIISHTESNSTHVLLEGPQHLVEKSTRVLPDTLPHVNPFFKNLTVTCTGSQISTQQLDSVKINETPVSLKRSDSSGEDLQYVKLDDISVGYYLYFLLTYFFKWFCQY
jgi:hypothetical protein